MFITGLGTAAPAQTYKQSEGWEAVQMAPQFSQLSPRSRAILRKVLKGSNGIEIRHLALLPGLRLDGAQRAHCAQKRP